jgi:hypothetical protein
MQAVTIKYGADTGGSDGSLPRREKIA